MESQIKFIVVKRKLINLMRNEKHRVLALFYENFDKFEESLEIWK